jgi:hypothetical protein
MKQITLPLLSMIVMLTAIAARADDFDFGCALSMPACSGTVSLTGLDDYSSTGITVYDDSGPYADTVPFMLAFDTSTGAISIDGTGVDAGQNLVGSITSFLALNGNKSTALGFSADWSTLPSDAQAFLGTVTGTDTGFVITTSLVSDTHAGKAGSVDVLITPSAVPEPGSILLLGTVMLALGALMKRKAVKSN